MSDYLLVGTDLLPESGVAVEHPGPRRLPVSVLFLRPGHSSATGSSAFADLYSPCRPLPAASAGGSSQRRGSECDEAAECIGEFSSKRLVLLDHDETLSGMSRKSGRHAKYPIPDLPRSSPLPATAKAGGAKHMEELVGKSSHLPKERIATEIVYRSIAHRELVELFDATFHHRALVVEPPCSKGVDARYVGEHMAPADHLEVSKQERIRAVPRPEWPAALNREQARPVERATCSPETVFSRAVQGGAAVVAEPLPDPAVTGHLEHVLDAECLQGLHHGLGEEALIEPERDIEHAGSTKAADQEAYPCLRPSCGVCVSSPPDDAKTITGFGKESQQRVMARPAPLLGIVPYLGPGLPLSVPHAHRGVQEQHHFARYTDPLPAGTDNVPDQLIENWDQLLAAPSEKAAKRGGIGYRPPAKEAANAARAKELEIIHSAATVAEERRPELDHETWTVNTGKCACPLLQPLPKTEHVPEAAEQEQTSAIGKRSRPGSEGERAAFTLHMGARWNMMCAHRLGVSDCQGQFCQEHLAI